MEAAQPYVIEWESKPLGFSIVMDTTAKNAYVSSIQKESNKNKGLKLAAQIIEINGENVKNVDHKQILVKIKQAQLPIKLKFQPRSFANDPKHNQEDEEIPTPLKFQGANVNEHRINGFFDLTKEKYNGKHQWQRDDKLDDPVLLWFWPKADANNTMKKDLWMISRKSKRGTQFAYACVESSCELPTDIVCNQNLKWKCYNPPNEETKFKGGFVDCVLTIVQEQQ